MIMIAQKATNYSGYVSALGKPRQVCNTYFEVFVLSVNMHSL